MTASSNKNSPYHRFIPREEVQVVSAWEFQSMDGKPPKAKASEQPPPTESEVQVVPELPAPDLELLRQQAFEEGFEQGRQAGEKATREALDAPLRRTAEDAARRLGLLLQTTEHELRAAEERLSEQLLQLACDLARQVVRRELEQNQDVLKAVIAEAFSQTVDEHLHRTVKLNPMDLALIQNHMSEWTDGGKVSFVAHDKLSAGGCLIETSACTVDASIEKRWARAVANIGMTSEWSPVESSDG